MGKGNYRIQVEQKILVNIFHIDEQFFGTHFKCRPMGRMCNFYEGQKATFLFWGQLKLF